MSVQLEKFNNNKLVCTFSERLDTINSIEAEKVILSYLSNNNIDFIEFDIKEVEYVASYFLRLCSIAINKLDVTENFSVINASPNVFNVFKMAGLCKHLNIK